MSDDGYLPWMKELRDGVVDQAGDGVEKVAKDRVINGLPGAGFLFENDFDEGFRLLPAGLMVTLGLAAYGLFKMAGGK